MRFCVVLSLMIGASVAFAAVRPTTKPTPAVNNCLTCHKGIEDIHPKPAITCVGCHFGHERAKDKAAAHRGMVRNPSDLRVVDKTCGRSGCHNDVAHRVKRSVMATGAGEISGFLYMRGEQKDKEEAKYHVGPVAITNDQCPMPGDQSRNTQDATLPLSEAKGRNMLPDGSESKLQPLPTYGQTGNPFFDLFRKECSQCHLWQEGVKRKGDYRASGCAACHVVYADDGLSQSGDPTIPKDVGGHPIKHQITTRIPTFQCVHCHNRGNRVGMNFQGKMEMPLRFDQHLQDVLHGQDYKDELPDVHHEKGMACIDCHTEAEVHGDGHIYRKKVYQLEIRCESCHGTADAPATLKTGKGRPLRNVIRKDEKVVLVSKVDGRKHVVPQVTSTVNGQWSMVNGKKIMDDADALHPTQSATNTAVPINHQPSTINHSVHTRLECYTCHSGWTPQCIGCHIRMDFTRYERPVPTAFDHIARVETSLGWFKVVNGVRTADKEPPLGVNHRDKIAPFMAGVHTVLTHVNEQGQTESQFRIAPNQGGLLSVAAPSIPHTVRREARVCVSCHRSDKALGIGTRTTAEMPKLQLFAPLDYPWDRIIDITGTWLQDTPLDKARPLNREEMERIRHAPLD